MIQLPLPKAWPSHKEDVRQLHPDDGSRAKCFFFNIFIIVRLSRRHFLIYYIMRHENGTDQKIVNK